MSDANIQKELDDNESLPINHHGNGTVKASDTTPITTSIYNDDIKEQGTPATAEIIETHPVSSTEMSESNNKMESLASSFSKLSSEFCKGMIKVHISEKERLESLLESSRKDFQKVTDEVADLGEEIRLVRVERDNEKITSEKIVSDAGKVSEDEKKEHYKKLAKMKFDWNEDAHEKNDQIEKLSKEKDGITEELESLRKQRENERISFVDEMNSLKEELKQAKQQYEYLQDHDMQEELEFLKQQLKKETSMRLVAEKKTIHLLKALKAVGM